MSDFDKEAERRRLREKYDEDEPRRQETARMSELLLKGATMTNRHCDNCGAPIFRYDGQEFCPNCQGGGAAEAESADAASGAEATAEADASATEAAASESDRPADGEATAPSRNGSDVDRDAVTSTHISDSDSSADAAERQRASASPPTSSASASSSPSSSAGTGESSTGATATDARDALLRAVTTHATRGEAADDPRRAREHLAAAREAAEAFSALDR